MDQLKKVNPERVSLKERSQNVLYKTLFSNIINELQNKVYVSYLSFICNYFLGLELMMLIFVSGIYSYGEDKDFFSVFGINELLVVEIEKKLLTKFQTFLFEVIQKYNIPINNRENGNALK